MSKKKENKVSIGMVVALAVASVLFGLIIGTALEYPDAERPTGYKYKVTLVAHDNFDDASFSYLKEEIYQDTTVIWVRYNRQQTFPIFECEYPLLNKQQADSIVFEKTGDIF